jgi:hypothetical protein
VLRSKQHYIDPNWQSGGPIGINNCAAANVSCGSWAEMLRPSVAPPLLIPKLSRPRLASNSRAPFIAPIKVTRYAGGPQPALTGAELRARQGMSAPEGMSLMSLQREWTEE